MKLPRRLALLLGLLAAAIGIGFFVNAKGLSVPGAILVAAALLGFVTASLVPRYHGQRGRVTIGLACHSAAVAAAAVSAFVLDGPASAIVPAMLFAAAVGVTLRAAAQAPRRRHRRFDDYFELKRLQEP
ncbi:MAG TPA: hypothetical protein VF577_08870 [Allosphingosinicella sp.]|jgi:drug/metabolite transporter (DMT)-like permease